MSTFRSSAATLLAAVALASPPETRALGTGDIVVVERDGTGPGAPGALFVVNRTSGVRALLSDFGAAGQGATGIDPVAAAAASANSMYVIDTNAGTAQHGALFRVDATTGARTRVSDFGDPVQGVLGPQPVALVVAAGTLYVVDIAGADGIGTVLRVDPVDGSRSVVSDFGAAGQGPLGADPTGIAIAASGSLLVCDEDAGTGGLGALFVVDPVSGARTLASDFGAVAQGPLGSNPVAIAMRANGTALVLDYDAGTNSRGGLFEIDLGSGARTLLSDLGAAVQGPIGDFPHGVSVEPAGTALVVDRDLGTAARGSVLRVDLVSGARTTLSDFGDSAQGPVGSTPIGIVSFRDPGQILADSFESN
jgi:hypothetical protein